MSTRDTADSNLGGWDTVRAHEGRIAELEHHQAELLDMLGRASRDIVWLKREVERLGAVVTTTSEE